MAQTHIAKLLFAELRSCHSGWRDNGKGYFALQLEPLSPSSGWGCVDWSFVCMAASYIMSALLMTFL